MAARDLGIIHLRGDVAAGVPQDYEAAARYFQQAAEGGVGEAHVELANVRETVGLSSPFFFFSPSSSQPEHWVLLFLILSLLLPSYSSFFLALLTSCPFPFGSVIFLPFPPFYRSSYSHLRGSSLLWSVLWSPSCSSSVIVPLLHFLNSSAPSPQLHQLGMGVPVNYSKAVEHLEIAAKEGHSTAHVGLGNLYM